MGTIGERHTVQRIRHLERPKHAQTSSIHISIYIFIYICIPIYIHKRLKQFGRRDNK